ncbi:hypothetical protein Q1695_007624 [Nippostrongylus brasiliensis]|nr:hypothetical protein Q1695_007624 [Nippostrongylus brasiliensis]
MSFQEEDEWFGLGSGFVLDDAFKCASPLGADSSLQVPLREPSPIAVSPQNLMDFNFGDNSLAVPMREFGFQSGNDPPRLSPVSSSYQSMAPLQNMSYEMSSTTVEETYNSFEQPSIVVNGHYQTIDQQIIQPQQGYFQTISEPPQQAVLTTSHQQSSSGNVGAAQQGSVVQQMLSTPPTRQTPTPQQPRQRPIQPKTQNNGRKRASVNMHSSATNKSAKVETSANNTNQTEVRFSMSALTRITEIGAEMAQLQEQQEKLGINNSQRLSELQAQRASILYEALSSQNVGETVLSQVKQVAAAAAPTPQPRQTPRSRAAHSNRPVHFETRSDSPQYQPQMYLASHNQYPSTSTAQFQEYSPSTGNQAQVVRQQEQMPVRQQTQQRVYRTQNAGATVYHAQQQLPPGTVYVQNVPQAAQAQYASPQPTVGEVVRQQHQLRQVSGAQQVIVQQVAAPQVVVATATGAQPVAGAQIRSQILQHSPLPAQIVIAPAVPATPQLLVVEPRPSPAQTAKRLEEKRAGRLSRLRNYFENLHGALANPDTDTPFSDLRDVLQRLLPYHAYGEPDFSEEHLEQFDVNLLRTQINLSEQRKRLEKRMRKVFYDEALNGAESEERNLLLYLDGEYEKRKLEEEKEIVKQGNIESFVRESAIVAALRDSDRVVEEKPKITPPPTKPSSSKSLAQQYEYHPFDEVPAVFSPYKSPSPFKSPASSIRSPSPCKSPCTSSYSPRIRARNASTSHYMSPSPLSEQTPPRARPTAKSRKTSESIALEKNDVSKAALDVHTAPSPLPNASSRRSTPSRRTAERDDSSDCPSVKSPPSRVPLELAGDPFSTSSPSSHTAKAKFSSPVPSSDRSAAKKVSPVEVPAIVTQGQHSSKKEPRIQSPPRFSSRKDSSMDCLSNSDRVSAKKESSADIPAAPPLGRGLKKKSSVVPESPATPCPTEGAAKGELSVESPFASTRSHDSVRKTMQQEAPSAQHRGSGKRASAVDLPTALDRSDEPEKKYAPPGKKDMTEESSVPRTPDHDPPRKEATSATHNIPLPPRLSSRKNLEPATKKDMPVKKDTPAASLSGLTAPQDSTRKEVTTKPAIPIPPRLSSRRSSVAESTKEQQQVEPPKTFPVPRNSAKKEATPLPPPVPPPPRLAFKKGSPAVPLSARIPPKRDAATTDSTAELTSNSIPTKRDEVLEAETSSVSDRKDLPSESPPVDAPGRLPAKKELLSRARRGVPLEMRSPPAHTSIATPVVVGRTGRDDDESDGSGSPELGIDDVIPMAVSPPPASHVSEKLNAALQNKPGSLLQSKPQRPIPVPPPLPHRKEKLISTPERTSSPVVKQENMKPSVKVEEEKPVERFRFKPQVPRPTPVSPLKPSAPKRDSVGDAGLIGKDINCRSNNNHVEKMSNCARPPPIRLKLKLGGKEVCIENNENKEKDTEKKHKKHKKKKKERHKEHGTDHKHSKDKVLSKEERKLLKKKLKEGASPQELVAVTSNGVRMKLKFGVGSQSFGAAAAAAPRDSGVSRNEVHEAKLKGNISDSEPCTSKASAPVTHAPPRIPRLKIRFGADSPALVISPPKSEPEAGQTNQQRPDAVDVSEALKESKPGSVTTAAPSSEEPLEFEFSDDSDTEAERLRVATDKALRAMTSLPGVPSTSVLPWSTQEAPTWEAKMAEQVERAFLKQPTINLNNKARILAGNKKVPRYVRNIGLGFKTPTEAAQGTYIDKKCPWTGNCSIRGNILTGVVLKNKMTRTIIVRRDYLHFVKKYRRFEKRHKNVPAHCSPAFRDIAPGDLVTIGECRPLSKTVRFNVLKVNKASSSKKGFAKF